MDFDLAVYSKEAILATAYWCADKCSADIRVVGSQCHVKLSPIGSAVIDGAFEERFRAMVIHNEIRAKLKAAFAPLETAIIQKAFAPVTQA